VSEKLGEYQSDPGFPGRILKIFQMMIQTILIQISLHKIVIALLHVQALTRREWLIVVSLALVQIFIQEELVSNHGEPG